MGRHYARGQFINVHVPPWKFTHMILAFNRGYNLQTILLIIIKIAQDHLCDNVCEIIGDIGYCCVSMATVAMVRYGCIVMALNSDDLIFQMFILIN